MKIIRVAIALALALQAAAGESEVDKVTEIISENFDRNRSFTVIDERDPRSLENRLSNMQKKEVECIYLNGINEDAFERCYGKNFAELEERFTHYYDVIREDFERTFSIELYNACEVRNAPCHELREYLHAALVKGIDPASYLRNAADRVSNPGDIDQERFKKFTTRLSQEYRILQNARNLIAAYSLKSVNKIRKFVKTADVPIPRSVVRYDPTKFYTEVGMGYSVVNKDQTLEQDVFDEDIDAPDVDLESETHIDHGLPFYDELLMNANSRNVINYHLSNSQLDHDTIDFAQMPNDILTQINIQLKEKKNLL